VSEREPQHKNANRGAKYPKIKFDWAVHDALPTWARLYLAFHPFNIHFAKAAVPVLRSMSADEVQEWLSNELADDRRRVARAALETYGPDHPQAARPDAMTRRAGQ
jgi:hypothetical protein